VILVNVLGPSLPEEQVEMKAFITITIIIVTYSYIVRVLYINVIYSVPLLSFALANNALSYVQL
jgi:hypothetical protein